MKSRDFIQETIDSLNESAVEIQTIWIEFQNGDITKEEFEAKYKQVLGGWLSELEHEEYTPNNGCKYSETKSSSKYFKEMDI